MKNTVNINDINYTLSELEKHLWLLLLGVMPFMTVIIGFTSKTFVS